MPTALLLWLSLGGFVAAAAIGLALLMAHARQRHVPIAPALFHGFFAGSGLILLLIAVFYGSPRVGAIGPWEIIALIVFFAAAVLGVTLLYLHIKTGTIPVALGAGHGATAAVGIIILFLALLIRGYWSAPAPLDPRQEPAAETRPTAPQPQQSPRLPEGSPDALAPSPPGQADRAEPQSNTPAVPEGTQPR